jgi:hypothetical protein
VPPLPINRALTEKLVARPMTRPRFRFRLLEFSAFPALSISQAGQGRSTRVSRFAPELFAMCVQRLARINLVLSLFGTISMQFIRCVIHRTLLDDSYCKKVERLATLTDFDMDRPCEANPAQLSQMQRRR